MMAKMSDSSGGQYPVFENEPLYLRATLVFPYTKGMLFQNAVTQRDGEECFRRGLQERADFDATNSTPGEVFFGSEANRSQAARSQARPFV